MKIARIFAIVLLLILLVGVRHYQEQLFYDPYLDFFENTQAYKNIALNEKSYEIMVGIGFRYLINATLTLGLIFLLFKKVEYVYNSLFILFLVFAVFFPIYYYFVFVDFRLYPMIGFYARRFMIQPIVLLLLVPSFYYLNKQK